MTVLFTAAQRICQAKINQNPPQLIIFAYQSSLLRYAVKSQQGKRVEGFFGDLYLLKRTEYQVGVAGNFGVGAPVVGVLLEEFVAWGVTQCVGIGLAGGLGESQQTGDLVVADRAVRDEGTSRHYLPMAPYAYPSSQLSQRWQERLLTNGQRFSVGGSWTTDAPYRETMEEVERYRSAGILAVEMEAAALFAVGEALRVSTAAAFAIGDTLKDQTWQLQFDPKKSQKGLEHLFSSAIQLTERVTKSYER